MRTAILALTALLAPALVACGGEPAATTATVAGTYDLVKDPATVDAGIAASAKEAGEEMPEEMARMMAEMVRNMIEKMEMTLELATDGTWTAHLKTPAVGDEAGETVAKGTWTHEGDRVTLTTTEQDGEARPEGDVKELVWKDGTLTLPKGDDAPFPLVLRRR